MGCTRDGFRGRESGARPAGTRESGKTGGHTLARSLRGFGATIAFPEELLIQNLPKFTL